MKKNLILPMDSVELRCLAEAKLQETANDQNPPPLPNTAEALRLVHELQVHQVELDLQNQALHELYEQLEQKLDRYARICDVAPVGSADLIARLQQAMAQTLGSQQWLMVGHLSLDTFKAISDAWGAAQGDRVLTGVMLRLKSCINASDTVAWLGGDEFALLLGDAYSLDECERLLQRLLTILQIPFPLDFGGTVQISASLGVTRYPDDDAAPEVLLDHANQALRQAKQAGGGRYHWFGQNPP